jgi:hypothetical protein
MLTAMERKKDVSEKQIDEAVEASFPASDPVSLHSTGAEVEPRRGHAVRSGSGGLRGWWRRVTGRQADDESGAARH